MLSDRGATSEVQVKPVSHYTKLGFSRSYICKSAHCSVHKLSAAATNFNSVHVLLVFFCGNHRSHWNLILFYTV